MASTQTKSILLPTSKVNIFYREENSSSDRVFLLLHGFPSSSHQYRNLIPLLGSKYRVLAPDLPGFGFTEVPEGFTYTFESLTRIVSEFLDSLHVSLFSLYVFDYGAPVGFRLALQRPQSIQGIVSQNGNAYMEGFGDVWGPIQTFWASQNTPQDRQVVADIMLTESMTKFQYVNGTPNVDTIAPESYTLDYTLLGRKGNRDIQLDLFMDYQNNVQLYEKFQEYFRTSQVSLLAVWGKNDVFFVPPGAEAFKRDLTNAQVTFLDAGHFAVESHPAEIANAIFQFFG